MSSVARPPAEKARHDPAAAPSVRVALSHEAFRMQRHGGVSRYATELHRGLLARGHQSEILAGFHRNEHLAALRDVRGLDISRIRPAIAAKAVTKLLDPAIERAWVARLGPGTVLHRTYYSGRVPKRRPLAVTVYDMIHERFPADFRPDDPTARWKRKLCEAADVIFAISDTTRDDLLERVAVDSGRVVVTPLGVRPPPRRPARVDDDRPTVLYVGDRYRRYKNFDLVLQALTRLDTPIRLVCFGGGPFSAVEQSRIANQGLADRVLWRSGDDGELAASYVAAAVMVYPSQFEGFGLPVLEAMANGCPVVCADRGPLPRIVGSAGWLFDPGSVDALVDALSTVVADRELSLRMSEAGYARACEYSWDRTVETTLCGYSLVDAATSVGGVS